MAVSWTPATCRIRRWADSIQAADTTAGSAAGVAIEKLEEAAAASGKASDTKSVDRSPTTLLVKNLPYTVTQAELQVRPRGPKRHCYNLMRSALCGLPCCCSEASWYSMCTKETC